ncbi:MAG: UDP-N-acetylmuramate:L-alanyl-gamma-D-glutamyl-meso-diaminopimelate ligase [Gammaproteobacteria bacterium]|nr:UDP-N-acetylmuramate:L-alanyl-gamma-D-glutamyl-meso-diaminopimelate ligase [Gammaproteobacteria bacterium]MYD79796.1 UDP-N-acetylmuramate:L-alanyl-gamma-D-glutamyl-meso-diaminopimelate ligase [Gammaproteobacteria bacterium]
MGNLAILAKQAGYVVGGFDSKIYPPMSDQLAAANISAHDRFDPSHLDPVPDVVVVGNASMPRGNPALEYTLNKGLNYQSGAEWLADTILRDRHVVAVSGTHGKTSTTAMVAWILHCAGTNPGFLIGGASRNFDHSAALGSPPFFAIEADEYDTSYFDRRSKFRHYRPKTLIIGNLEFDHADIFSNLDEIKYQFHHLIREIPANGTIIVPSNDTEIDSLLARGCWSPIERFTLGVNDQSASTESTETTYSAVNIANDGTSFDIMREGSLVGSVRWSQFGLHNVANAMSAILAANHCGIDPKDSSRFLADFRGVKRRMEVIARAGRTTVYSDFAHHPTAIQRTLDALRQHVGEERILAVIEPRTHTMSLGTHRERLRSCCSSADEVVWYRPKTIKWNLDKLARDCTTPSSVHSRIEDVVDIICKPTKNPVHVVIMSNGGFDGIFAQVTDSMQRL